MNTNEPVAELLVNDGEPWGCRYNDNITLQGIDGWIPLYTHPANHVTDSDYADAILQRDNYHAIADNLAEAIGVYFGVDVGEHSSGNNPWEFALGIIEDTHPAKTLTDEEIIKVYQSLWKFLPAEEPRLAKDIKDFARAILRKAQKK